MYILVIERCSVQCCSAPYAIKVLILCLRQGHFYARAYIIYTQYMCYSALHTYVCISTRTGSRCTHCPQGLATDLDTRSIYVLTVTATCWVELCEAGSVMFPCFKLWVIFNLRVTNAIKMLHVFWRFTVVRIHNETFVNVVWNQCFLPSYLTLWNCM